jgi:hypothetical protein
MTAKKPTAKGSQLTLEPPRISGNIANKALQITKDRNNFAKSGEGLNDETNERYNVRKDLACWVLPAQILVPIASGKALLVSPTSLFKVPVSPIIDLMFKVNRRSLTNPQENLFQRSQGYTFTQCS